MAPDKEFSFFLGGGKHQTFETAFCRPRSFRLTDSRLLAFNTQLCIRNILRRKKWAKNCIELVKQIRNTFVSDELERI